MFIYILHKLMCGRWFDIRSGQLFNCSNSEGGKIKKKIFKRIIEI